MTILNPEHLIQQATALSAAPSVGAPRQADLRRATSTAYYAVFHFVLTAAADQFVGKTKRASPIYSLVYRSVDHRGFRNLCREATKQHLSVRYADYGPAAGFERNIRAFSAAALELQDKRYAADYDPMFRMKSLDATQAVRTARTALRRFSETPADQKALFLGLLLFPPRRGAVSETGKPEV